MTEDRYPLERVIIQTEPDTAVAVDRQMLEKPVAHAVVIHGLEGDSGSGYIRSLSRELLGRGVSVHRFNMRSCGGTEHLSRTNYHAGQTSDVWFVLHEIRKQWSGPLFLIGFSLGGNVSLKLAGEMGTDALGLLDGVCAVSTPIDLAACSDALEAPRNFIYENRFLIRLKDRVRRRAAQYPDRYDTRALAGVRTIRQFDDAYTAKLFGFGTVANYFATQSSNQFLGDIRVPALLIQAKDDPLIPFDVYERAEGLRGNTKIRLVATDHGGHVGFIARGEPRFWVDRIIADWLA